MTDTIEMMGPIEMYFTKQEVDALSIAIDEKLRRIQREIDALQYEYNRLDLIKMMMLKKLKERGK